MLSFVCRQLRQFVAAEFHAILFAVAGRRRRFEAFAAASPLIAVTPPTRFLPPVYFQFSSLRCLPPDARCDIAAEADAILCRRFQAAIS